MLHDIIEALETYQDLNRLDMGKQYHPTRMKIIGVTVPNEKKVLKEVRKLTHTFSPSEKIALGIELVETGIFECQHIAYEYLGKDLTVMNEISEKNINSLGKNLDNWVSVDGFSIYITGKAWQLNRIGIDKILLYLSSDDHWIRRIAVVSTVSLNLRSQGGKGDPEKTLNICSRVVDDHHDMIVKALSWALRELSKQNKDVVFDFLDTYENKIHPKVKREVMNKLITGKKNI